MCERRERERGVYYFSIIIITFYLNCVREHPRNSCKKEEGSGEGKKKKKKKKKKISGVQNK